MLGFERCQSLLNFLCLLLGLQIAIAVYFAVNSSVAIAYLGVTIPVIILGFVLLTKHQLKSEVQRYHTAQEATSIQIQQLQTELDQQHQNLRNAEAELAKVEQLARIGSWNHQVSTGITQWSEELYRIHGRNPNLPPPTPEETLNSFIHPEDHNIYLEEVLHKVLNGQPFDTFLRLILSPKDIRHIHTRGELIYNNSGALASIIGTAQDVTFWKQAEEKLRKSEANLSAAQQLAHIGSWEFDVQSQQISGSEEVYRIFGLPSGISESTYTYFFNQIHPEDQVILSQCINRSITDGIPYELEFRALRADGSIRYLLGKGQAIPNHQGQVERIFGTIQDITERRETEIALRTIEERFERAIQGSNDGFWEWMDVSQEELWFSPRLFEICGYEPDEFTPTLQQLKQMIHPEDCDRVFQQLQAHLDQQVPYDIEYRLQSKSGHYLWIRFKGQAVRDHQGKPLRMAGSAINISEAKQREAELQRSELELQKAKEAAEAANRSKSQFLSSMSHELRTPLNAILGFAQLLTREANLTPENRDAIEIINRNGQHLLELINDVLEMSKIEADRIQLNPQSFDLYRLLKNLDNLLNLKANAKHLTLSFEISPLVPHYLIADESKLRQILLNLLGNAIKFTEKGSVILRVSPLVNNQQIYSPNLRLQFTIEDTGVGIASSEIQHLFKPFTQTQSGRKTHEGTGLGLAITKRLVNLMNGEITVNSIIGKGSIFEFTIPAQLANPDEFKTSTFTHRVIGLKTDHSKPRILIIEDNHENAKFLTRLLTKIGFEIQEVDNGQKGIKICQSWHPQLILMDMQMPVMDGYEATRYIKTQEIDPPVIIAVTGSAFEEDRFRILSIGCDDFIRKPLQEEILLSKIAHHLEIEYLYEQIPEKPKNPEPELNLVSLLKTIMPQSWIEQFNQSVRACDAQKTMQIIEEIPGEFSLFSKALKELVIHFDFEKLAEIIHLSQS